MTSPTSRTIPQTENEIQREILDALDKLPGMWCRMNTGLIKGKNGFLRFGIKGGADIWGITQEGRTVFIEVKTPKGKLSEDQEQFKARVESIHCKYIVARSVEDALVSLGVYIPQGTTVAKRLTDAKLLALAEVVRKA